MTVFPSSKRKATEAVPDECFSDGDDNTATAAADFAAVPTLELDAVQPQQGHQGATGTSEAQCSQRYSTFGLRIAIYRVPVSKLNQNIHKQHNF